MAGTGPPRLPDEAMMDLLVKQVTEGLSSEEQRALDAMDGAVATTYLRDLERAAAAVSLAGTPVVEPPAALRALLEQQANDHFAALAVDRPAVAPIAPNATVANNVVTLAPPARRRGGALGWFAAAACLVLALVGWLRSPSPTEPPAVANGGITPPAAVEPVPVPVPSPPPAAAAQPTPAEARAAMLARANSLKVSLGATKDPSAQGVSGDVVWDPATNQGFVRFVGLRANDPAVHQYQIWIFDGERDQRYPVDGGVFDVPADASEVVIPIHATLPIRSAKAFAVTVEKPGGVVVSARGHVVALGAVG